MEPLQVSVILEIMGRPASNVTEAMAKITDELSEEKGIKILEKKDNTPVEIKDGKNLFTTFTELTLELETVHHLFGVVFRYLPSNIEVIHPQNMKLTNEELSMAANQLTQRMHNYDAVTKKTLAENEFMAKKLMQYEPELFKTKEQAQEQTQETKTKKPSKKKKAKK
jgi:hypothetical protein